MIHPRPEHPTRPASSSLALAATVILGLGCALLFTLLAVTLLLAEHAR